MGRAGDESAEGISRRAVVTGAAAAGAAAWVAPSILSFDAAAAGTQGVPVFRNVTNPFPSVFSATDLDINVTSGTGAAGDVLVLVATVSRNGGGASPPDIDDPSGWTLIDNAPTSDVRTKAWYKLAAGAAAETVTVTRDTTGGTEWALGGVIARFGNAVGVDVAAQAVSGGTESATVTYPAVTTTETNTLLLFANGTDRVRANNFASGTERWDYVGIFSLTRGMSMAGATAAGPVSPGLASGTTSALDGLLSDTANWSALTIAVY